jgi:streptogramin lyase
MSRRRRAVGGGGIAAAVIGAALAWGALASADAPSAGTPYVIPTAGSMPAGISTGPADGNLWFTEAAGNRLGSITPAGAITEPAGATGLTGPTAIAPGITGTPSAGMLFFTEPLSRSLGEYTISPGTSSTEVHLRGGDIPTPGGVALDSQGNVWVTITNAGVINELVPPYEQSNVTAFPSVGGLDRGLARPGSITLGPDGNMWFTEVGTDRIATIVTPATGAPGVIVSAPTIGTITEYPSSSSSLTPAGTLGNIVVGPDGNLWVGTVGTNGNPSAVLQITPAGAVTPFDIPSGSTANPDVLAVGPDGELWMPDGNGGVPPAMPDGDGGLTSVTTAGVFTHYAGFLPAGDTITAMHADPGAADALWLTDETANAIYRVPLAPPPPPVPQQQQPPPPPPPALSATIAPVSALSTSGATLSGTISEPVGSPPTAVSYRFQYGTSTSYAFETPAVAATVTPSGVNVSAPLSGLAHYTTYHYRLVATDCPAASCQVVSPDQSFTTGSTLQPTLDVTVGATVTAGTILVKLPGHHGFKRLHAGELIPLGSTIDARHGTVLIQSAIAGPSGEYASGLFSDGIFTVTQPAGGTVIVLVLNSSFKSCPKATPTKGPLASAAALATSKKKTKKPVSHKVVNQVFGNAHGQFKTRGSYATAADQGTAWRTSDRCDGTQISVSAGMVTVTDRVHHRTFVLTAGHRYLARTP